jgi:uncharacterized membrane protein
MKVLPLFQTLCTGWWQRLIAAKEIVWGAVLYVLCHPALVEAGLLSQSICRPYRQLVDSELFIVIAAIVAVILVIVWKLAPAGGVLAKGVGLLAAVAIGLNIENILVGAFGVGIAC